MYSEWRSSWSTGLTASTLACSVPVLIISQSAIQNNLNTFEISSWIFGSYLMAGVLGLIFSIYFKLPICGSPSVPAAVFLGTALNGLSINEAAALYLLSGLLVILIGFTKIFKYILKLIPYEVVMAMTAGLIFQYMFQIYRGFSFNFLLALFTVSGFLITKSYFRNIPAMLGAIIPSTIAYILFYGFPRPKFDHIHFLPKIIKPEFNLEAILPLLLPMICLILFTELFQGMESIHFQGYHTPANQMVTFSGIAIVLASFLGSHGANTAGALTTLCSSDEAGEKHQRYRASIIVSILMVLFALLSPFLISIVTVIHIEYIFLLTGIAMLPVLAIAMDISFSKSSSFFSVIFTLSLSMTNTFYLQIHSSFWAIVAGTFIYYVFEKEGKGKLTNCLQILSNKTKKLRGE
ncbi:benzoate/H(+) symporter BenE family transporter [Bacillus sp. ISL-47]|uniref:benzoate/H(+) symporter BenE family transporter n=1 Tax=Bacillus sp. ISL-47 TaxID=2819130 RepID=UPI001BEBC660|nr:benzoate/H(+) symporter BenE family transporter [Bacillus sp. ISL-47]MBT2686798.1 benzoate/H(+) symporter BenE family transporter [Bacillus sp. ISL-47]MBT2706849.1 benzoate/H(+) symporter BenE family transporter [Pseudomonas sp. ISL-84]